MILHATQRCSSMAESSSNIENVISVGVGGSGASDAVTFVFLEPWPDKQPDSCHLTAPDRPARPDSKCCQVL